MSYVHTTYAIPLLTQNPDDQNPFGPSAILRLGDICWDNVDGLTQGFVIYQDEVFANRRWTGIAMSFHGLDNNTFPFLIEEFIL